MRKPEKSASEMARLRWNKPDARANASARLKAHWSKVSAEDKRAAALKMVAARQAKQLPNGPTD